MLAIGIDDKHKLRYLTSLKSVDNLKQSQDFIAEVLHKHNLDDEICRIILLVFDEICVNVFTYNNLSKSIKLDVEVVIYDNEIKLIFIDNGIFFSLQSKVFFG